MLINAKIDIEHIALTEFTVIYKMQPLSSLKTLLKYL